MMFFLPLGWIRRSGVSHDFSRFSMSVGTLGFRTRAAPFVRHSVTVLWFSVMREPRGRRRVSLGSLECCSRVGWRAGLGSGFVGRRDSED